jgi:exonuclease III
MPCTQGLLVAHFYRPPDGSQYLDPDFLPKFQDMMSTATSEGKEIIILGDLKNLSRDLVLYNWLNNQRESQRNHLHLLTSLPQTKNKTYLSAVL